MLTPPPQCVRILRVLVTGVDYRVHACHAFFGSLLVLSHLFRLMSAALSRRLSGAFEPKCAQGLACQAVDCYLDFSLDHLCFT